MAELRFGELIERPVMEGRLLTEIVAEFRKVRRCATVDERTDSHYAREHGPVIQDMGIAAVPSASGKRESDSELRHREPTAVALQTNEAPAWPPPPTIPSPPREWLEAWGNELGRFFEDCQAECGWRDFRNFMAWLFEHERSLPAIRRVLISVLDTSIHCEEKIRAWARGARELEKAYLERRSAEHLRELEARWRNKIRA